MQTHIYAILHPFKKSLTKNRAYKRLLNEKSRWSSFILFVGLSGCMGIYEGGFECPPGKGVGCKSISEVNQMINAGLLPVKPMLVPSSECKDCGEDRTGPSLPSSSLEEARVWYVPSEWSPVSRLMGSSPSPSGLENSSSREGRSNSPLVIRGGR